MNADTAAEAEGLNGLVTNRLEVKQVGDTELEDEWAGYSM